MRQGLIITLEPVQQVSEIEREAYNGRAPPTLMGMHLEVHPVMHVDRHALRMHPGVHAICTPGAHLSFAVIHNLETGMSTMILFLCSDL